MSEFSVTITTYDCKEAQVSVVIEERKYVVTIHDKDGDYTFPIPIYKACRPFAKSWGYTHLIVCFDCGVSIERSAGAVLYDRQRKRSLLTI